ncbi:MAG TPA: cyclophilin-like fold protein [Propionicimonas sp.]|jgi:hypothetical protein|nr:cyclophilin-like fold protein [Propionicimonas sp.]
MNTHRGPRRPHRIRLSTLLALLTLTACTSDAPGAPTTPGSAPPGPTRITVTIGGHSYQATLADNPTTRELIDQLPLTLAFTDFNRVEKIATLPRPLTTQGAPTGTDPEINDIGYYRPGNNLVLYYGDVGYFNGIVRLGSLPEGMDAIARQPDGFTATIASAGTAR